MRYFSSSRHNEKGRSMIEMLGVLAIIGVLSVGGLAGYNMAMEKIRIQRFIEEFMSVLSEVLDISSLQAPSDVSGTNTLSLNYIDMKGLKTALAAISSDATVSPPGLGNRSSYDFFFYFYNVPSQLCMEMVKADFGMPVCFGDHWQIKIPSEEAVQYCSSGKKVNVNLLFNVRNSYCYETK